MGGQLPTMDSTFTKHVHGEIVRCVRDTVPASELKFIRDFSCNKSSCDEPDLIYRHFARRGNLYGPSFQGIKKVKTGSCNVWGDITISKEIIDRYGGVDNYFVHPAFFDNALQLGYCALSEDGTFFIVAC
jgi:hypothetical protein